MPKFCSEETVHQTEVRYRRCYAIADAGCEPGIPWFDGDTADPAEIARMTRTSFQEVW